jgi:hypothetical protein
VPAADSFSNHRWHSPLDQAPTGFQLLRGIIAVCDRRSPRRPVTCGDFRPSIALPPGVLAVPLWRAGRPGDIASHELA